MNCKKHREITHFGQEIESKSKLCNENNPTVKKLSFMRACVLNYQFRVFAEKQPENHLSVLNATILEISG